MPAKKKNGNGNGKYDHYSVKQMKRRKPINLEHLKVIEPLTPNQELVFDAYDKGQNLVLHGAAGTGKTFISLYLAIQQVLEPSSPYEKVYMVRSLVPTREIGSVSYTHLTLPTIYSV